MAEITLLATVTHSKVYPIYTNAAMRTNGLGIDVRISNALALTGSCTTNDMSFLIQLIMI